VVRVAYNSVNDEFLVTFQRDRMLSDQSHEYSIVAQRCSTSSASPLGAETALVSPSINTFKSHAIAYAPTGQYLLAYDGGGVTATSIHLQLFNYLLNPAYPSWLTIDEEPDGREDFPDIAWGRIQGKDRFLVVWADGNNCRPDLGSTSCPNEFDQWKGIWGCYVDPLQLTSSNDIGRQFPISKLPYLNQFPSPPRMPRTAFNKNHEAFFVAWREIPYNNPGNDENRTHIRGNIIDYYMPCITEESSWSIPPAPPDNIVLSNVSGTCPENPAYVGDCPSEEDPVYPDVAAINGPGAVVVWQQQYPGNHDDHDIKARVMMLPAPANDLKTTALDLPLPPGDETLNIEPLHLDNQTIAGANHDGMATCGYTETEPDVWYRFIAPSTGRFNVTTYGTWDMWGIGTGMDTVLSLHRPDGTPIPGMCNDDVESSTRDSLLELPLLRGEELLVRVSRFRNSTGTTFRILPGQRHGSGYQLEQPHR